MTIEKKKQGYTMVEFYVKQDEAQERQSLVSLA